VGGIETMSKVSWTQLESADQLQALQVESETQPVIIFKHSFRCSTSQMMLGRLERSDKILAGAKMYFLDLLKNRHLSDMVEEVFDVRHESPQLLLIRRRAAVLHLSHFEIEPEVVGRALA
jgi:bacillithiol system protein YtxJ